MKLSDITIFKSNIVRTGSLLFVGEFILNEGNLSFAKDIELLPEEYKCTNGRVYILSINDDIVKIGGSADKNGIKGTIQGYLSGKKGSPGESRFALNTLITEEINNGKSVQLHMILCPETYVKINGLTNENNLVSVFAFKEIEKQCLTDYKEFNDDECPLWNFKERGEAYPSHVREAYAKYKLENAK